MRALKDKDNLIETLSEKIRAAEVRESPYPHFFVPDVFPQGWFNDIRAALPDNLSYASTDPRRTTNMAALKFRRRINLSESDIDFLPESSRATWECVSAALTSQTFSLAIKQLLSAHLVDRYGTTELDTRTRVELIRDQEGYLINPHTDAPHKIITLLFYLPPNNRHTELGTSVYVPKDRTFTSEAGTQFDPADFEEVFRAPFQSNSVFGFMKNERSFHGRQLISDYTGFRDWMNCSIQLKDRFVGGGSPR